MARELVSARTRTAFREYFVGYTLAEIDDVFRSAGISFDPNYIPPMSGQRRSSVERYYKTLDFTRSADIRKLLEVYEHALDALERQIKFSAPEVIQYAVPRLDKLRALLQRDGYTWTNGRLVAPHSASSVQDLHEAVSGLDAPELNQQLARLRESVTEDPSLAIGTAKEMLETTCKTILGDLDVSVDSDWDVPTLLKETRKHLKLLPEDVPASAKGADTIRRLLSNLGQLGHGLSELRNLYGSGHGRAANSKSLSARHARLAVGAVATLVQFLFETHAERRASPRA